MVKKIYKYSEAKDKVLHAIDTIADPIKQTLGPKGGNVLYEDSKGDQYVTNDGVTIARNIKVADDVENAIIEVIKHSALKTNNIAGDGPQPYWSKIMTPDGYKTMGEIKAGDKILGTNESVQTVEAVIEKGVKDIYEVVFSDGRVVECSEEHLWNVVTDSGTKKVLTTKEIIDSGIYREKRNGSVQYKYFVPRTIAYHNEVDLPIDPYTLGILLGDGSLSGTGSVELSLGKDKKHIIEKIKLPDGITKSIKYYKDKNYYRVKIIGTDKHGNYIKDILDDIGLYGVRSNNKFIPSLYLYSSINQRRELLNGLIDTDGYINKNGLIEYSTVSKQLAEDVVELMYSLGKVASVRLHSRENDYYSYSNTPIYRITENKGCKYGHKIVDVRNTGNSTKMRCIKVSNNDKLYLTDGYIPTHNTSTTILYSSILTKEGLKLVEEGENQMVVRDQYIKYGEKLKEKLKKRVKKIKNDEDLFFISKISANNDEDIARDVVRVVKAAGEDGMVFIEDNFSPNTEIVEDAGFVIDSGYFTSELITNKNRFTATYKDVPVLVTDKRLYYAEEAETILKTCLENGYRDVVIVAKDFIGEALPYFVANHQQGNMGILLVKQPKDDDGSILDDLAVYLGGKVVTEKTGSIVDNLSITDFCISPKVFADGVKTIIGRDKNEANANLTHRITALKKEIKKMGDKNSSEKKALEKRLASLTNGMVTIKVGGRTPLEVREKIFRFEDAVNAARAAKKDGYLIGGGLSVYKAFRDCKFTGPVGKIFQKMCEANIRQIAENSGLYPDNVIETINLAENDNIGYNALTGQYEDLLEAGVVDPYKVTEMAIDNAISIANIIITSRYLIVNDKENYGDSKNKKDN